MSLSWQSLREVVLVHISEKWKAFWHDKNVDPRCNKTAIQEHHPLEKSLWGGYRLLATLTGQHPYGEDNPRLNFENGKWSLNHEAYLLLRYAQLSRKINETANTYFDNIPDHMRLMLSPVNIAQPFCNGRLNWGLSHYVKINDGKSVYIILRNVWSAHIDTFLSDMDNVTDLNVGQLHGNLAHTLASSFWLRETLDKHKGMEFSLEFQCQIASKMKTMENLVRDKNDLLRVFAAILIAEECHYTYARPVNNLYYFTKIILKWLSESSDLDATVNLKNGITLRIEINQSNMDLTNLEQCAQREKRRVLLPPPACA